MKQGATVIALTPLALARVSVPFVLEPVWPPGKPVQELRLDDVCQRAKQLGGYGRVTKGGREVFTWGTPPTETT